MALETGYQRQVEPRPAAPLPAPGPENFGAGIGDQLQQTAAVAHREGLQGYQVQRQAAADAERTTKFAELADFKAQVLQQRDALRQNAAPGAAGHLEAVGQLVDSDATAPLLDGVKEDKTRQWLQQEIAGFRGELLTGENTFAAAKGVEKTLADAGSGLDTLANHAAASPDPQTWPDAHKQWQSYVAGLTLDGNDKQGLLRDGGREIDFAKGRQLADSDPQTLLALLDHGTLDDSLKPEDIATLRERASVEIRSQQVAARTQAALARHAVEDQVATTLKLVHDGGEVDPQALAGLRAGAVAAGADSSRLYDIDAAIAANTVNREFRAAAPQAISAEIGQLDQQLAGEKTGDPALVLRRKALAELLPARRQQIASDLVGWAAQNGLPTAPFIDANPDAAAATARIAAVDAAAKAAGVPPKYLTADEEHRFRALADSGQAGELEALHFASRFGADKARIVAQQIRPSDDGFAWLTQLADPVQALALRGRAAIKGNPKIFAYVKADHPELVTASGVQDSQFAQATIGMDERQRNAVRVSADRIRAGLVAEGRDATDPALRWQALNMALGAEGTPGPAMKGGLAAFGPGVTLVPATMTRGEFAQQIRAAWAHDPPANPDGTPANLSAAIPRKLFGSPGYMFVSQGGQPFRRKDGSLYTVTVR